MTCAQLLDRKVGSYGFVIHSRELTFLHNETFVFTVVAHVKSVKRWKILFRSRLPATILNIAISAVGQASLPRVEKTDPAHISTRR